MSIHGGSLAGSMSTTSDGDSITDEQTPVPELVDENAPVSIMPSLMSRLKPQPESYDVCIVGAGPAGLMLGLTLARFGIHPLILDERAEQTATGRADAMQPKTIETLRMLGLADELLQQGVKVFDICLWHAPDPAAAAAAESSPSETNTMDVSTPPTTTTRLHRVGRHTHYPAFLVDLADPFVLACHQGMVEKVFIEDLAKRGVTIRRCHRFDDVSIANNTMQVHTRFNVTRDPRIFEARYLVGCDGAHSRVRSLLLSAAAAATTDRQEETTSLPPNTATNKTSVWGVLDGEVDTDFPDIRTKSVVFSDRYGSLLAIPRERDMTRFYIEMRPEPNDNTTTTTTNDPSSSSSLLFQSATMHRAAQILHPYRIRWRSIAWSGQYRVAQHVAPHFSASLPTPSPPPSFSQQHHDHDHHRVFIAGDAAHTHSPKAAQGMNTALHDAWNLAWKLNLALRGLASASSSSPHLLESYDAERRKIARDLVAFDFDHAYEMSRGDPIALADHVRTNVRFISGVGVEYGPNCLNHQTQQQQAIDDDGGGGARPGCTLPPGKVRRYIDANPVDVQLDIPVLCQFRVYFFVPSVMLSAQRRFLHAACDDIARESSLLSRLSAAATKSYREKPRVASPEDVFRRPERYTAVSQLFAFALITSTPKREFELTDLPSLLSRSPWTLYTDDVPDLDTQGSTCTLKYLGPSFTSDEAAILVVRPDGYVGALRRWSLVDTDNEAAVDSAGREAAAWLERYFDGFLAVPE